MKFYDFFGPKPCAYAQGQLLRIMKITTIILTAFLLQVSASTKAQRINMSTSNSSLKKTLADVRRQTGFIVLYKSEQLKQAQPVSVHLDHATLEEAMKEILKGQDLTFLIRDQSILILQKEKTEREHFSNPFNIDVKGRVIDENSKPLSGASVKVKNGNKVASSNANGEFTLSNVTEDALLQISFIGYQTREVKASEDLSNIVLSPSNDKLQELVVVGYNSQKRANITGAVVTLQAKDIDNSSVVNPLQSLEGKVPGLSITQGSGQPGVEKISVTLRGPTSFAKNSPNTPLVLINGVVGDITTLDPSFIESVTVLKDASAAIYGARGANGVILVTTKTGAKDSKLNVEFNSSYVNQSAINQPARVWNSVDYMTMKNTAIQNAGGGATPYDQNTIDLYKNTPGINYPSFNWWDFMVKPVNIFNNTLSIGGRTGNTNFHAGMGVWNQDGIVKGFNYQKYTGMFSMDSEVSKRFKFGVSFNGVSDPEKEPYNGVNDVLLATLAQAPTYSPYVLDGSGHYAWRAWNAEWPQKPPLAVTENGGQWTNRFLLNATAYTQLRILDHLTWEVKGGMRSVTTDVKAQTPVIPIYNFITGAKEGYSNGVQTIDLTQTSRDSKYYTAYTTLNYTRTFFNDLNLDVLIGASEEKSVDKALQGYRRGFASQELDVLNAAPSDGQSTGASQSDYSLRSQFGRFNLNYKSKYLMDVTVRRDGSSRFPPTYKYAYFPSLALGWRISQESFFSKNVSWVDELKLRASYGKLGNDNVNGNYPFQSTLSTGANYPFADQGGVRLGNLANEKLKWESTSSKNIGLDFSIKHGQLYGSFDYYIKTTSDILRQQQVPAYSGAGSPNVNQGIVDNKGIELIIGHRGKIGELTYGLEGNITRQRNKLRNFGAPAYNGNTFMKEGYEMNRYFTYQADGIYQSQAEIDNGPKTPWVEHPGDVKIKDVNGDGKVNADDRVDVDGINPNYYYGLNIYANWKGFDFSLFLQGEQGRKALVTGEYSTLMPFGGGTAPLTWWQDSWTPENHSTVKPIMDYYYGPNGGSTRQASTFWLKDVSYLRVKNITIGYTIPAALTRRAAMQKVRVFLNAQNLFTITKYEFGDPENPSNGGAYTYPLMRSLTFGLNIQF
ncbi:hypothetical protein DBR11_08620 [Pedobacter sp. HMWF019]|uniref:TonB-dependent receptor n=1 Tax=Pedobacter sp. HMWF019 TaxID=2056856 RepID=UPI000D3586E0|nr:TonB-dependent receptor [Pedobacter sp. HMWF019]PTT00940.1 hypothetical protein DBR11_08620 [Pedobacter sp. HMWF019]